MSFLSLNPCFLTALTLIICSNLIEFIKANRIETVSIELSQNNIGGSIAISYNSAFLNRPHFSYCIQNIELDSYQLYINHTHSSITQTSLTITFDLFYLDQSGLQNNLGNNQVVLLLLVFTDFQEGLQMGFQTNLALNAKSQSIINYSLNHQNSSEYQIIIYGLCFPLIFQIEQKNETSTIIKFDRNPSLIASTVSLSYIIIQKIHIVHHIFCIFDQLNKQSPNYILELDSQNYIQANSESIFIGIQQLDMISIPLKIVKYQNFDYVSPKSSNKAIKIGFQLLGTAISKIKSTVVAFNNDIDGCYDNDGNSGYFAYDKPFKNIPAICIACDMTCKTCTASQIMTYTDQYYCTSCSDGRYFQQVPNTNYGQCPCLKGLQTDQNGLCIPCQINCLTFVPEFMRESTNPQFLLIFTFSELTFDQPFQQNMLLSINGKSISYNISEHRKGAYLIDVEKQQLIQCQQSCQAIFFFVIPHYVHTDTKFLTDQQKKLEIRNFYIVEQIMPENLQEVFFIIGSIIAVSAAAGQSSFLKVLFQLQQLIQFHKYLNLDIPVVFKEFLEALSTFKFMDILSIIPFDINSYMQNLSSNQLDLKGSAKIVYYQNGVNFYKNTIPVILSFLAVILINLLIFFILKLIPCQFFKKLAGKIKIRWLITLSDMIQSLILPVLLFTLYQTTYMVMTPSMIWVNFLAFFLSFILLIFPFIVILYTAVNKKFQKDDLMRQILEDLLQDCNMSYTMSYITYVYSFLRKTFSAIFLLSPLPGLIQISGMLLINIVQLLIVVYLVKEGIFLSKIKIITRTINIVCVIAIQFLILAYNMTYSDLQGMILMGIACTYFAVISTAAGLLEMVVKILDIVLQKLRKEQKIQVFPQLKTDRYVGKAECKIGKPLKKQNQKQKNKKRKAYHFKDDQQSNNDKMSNFSDLIPIQSEDGFTVYHQSVNISSQQLLGKKYSTKKRTSRRYSQLENNDLHSQNRQKTKSDDSSQNLNDNEGSFYRRKRNKIKATKKSQKPEDLVISYSKKDSDSMSDIIEIDYEEDQYQED